MPRALIIEPPLVLPEHFIDYPYFGGLGAYQAAAVLRQAGWQVEVVDGFAHPEADWARGPGHMAWLGQPEPAFIERIRRQEANLVILHTSPFLLAPLARDWLRRLVAASQETKPSLLALADAYVGGMHYLEVEPRALLASVPGVDLLLRYECEPLLMRLVEQWDQLPPTTAAVWENREPFALDDLPAPAFDLLDAEAFFGFLARTFGAPWRPGPMAPEPSRTLPLVTARGCPFGCSFCTKNPGLPEPRRQTRAVPLSSIDQWVSDWVTRFNLRRLVVLDELANLDPLRFDGLLALAERLRLRLEFPNGLRADLVTEGQVERLARLTERLKVSLESASCRVQNELLEKRLDPAAVEHVASWCHRHHLPLDVHYLVGIPGETRREIRSTLELASRLFETHRVRPLLQFATPLPGTRLGRICSDQGLAQLPSADPWAAFQGRSVVHTAEFDPDWLEEARWLFEQRVNRLDQRKVIVNLTYQCNNRCVFCAVADRPRRHAEFAQLCRQLACYRQAGYDHLDLDGGEPTLHPQLLAVIAEAKRLGFRHVTLVTNGRRLAYAPYARQITRSGVDEVLVSLHAPDPELAAELTSVRESFMQTTTGLRHLLAWMPSTAQVGVNTTVVGDNLDRLPALGEYLAGLGVARWSLQLVTPFGRAHAGLFPVEAELEHVLGPLLDAPPAGLQLHLVNCPPCLVPGHERAASADFAKAARDMVFVGSSGENLQDFLAQRRRHTTRCSDCLYALACPGEWQAESAPGSGEDTTSAP
jgi:MoaA/NifB/PqqE/SkfB family radical SAM enzyme